MKRLVIILILALVPGWAGAQSVPGFERLYIEGDFEGAVAAGRAAGTKEGLQYALRSQLVIVQYILQPEDRMPALEKAIAEARAGLEKYPDDTEIVISTGILIGLRGRLERSISDGKEAKKLFERALELDPEQPWALGALGSWHAETVAEGGIIAARLVMGARKKNAYEFFERSIEKDPANMAIRAAYIRGLLKLKPEKFSEKIQAHIDFIKNGTPANALEKICKEQILQIEVAWKAGDEETLEMLLAEARPLIWKHTRAPGQE